MVEYDDLSEQQSRELPSLKIADSSKFSQGLIPAIPKVRQSMDQFSIEQQKKAGLRSGLLCDVVRLVEKTRSTFTAN